MRRLPSRPLGGRGVKPSVASAAVAPNSGVLWRELDLDGVERLADLRRNQAGRGRLIDVRRVPVEDGALFFDEFSDAARKLGAVTVHFDLFDFGRSRFPKDAWSVRLTEI